MKNNKTTAKKKGKEGEGEAYVQLNARRYAYSSRHTAVLCTSHKAECNLRQYWKRKEKQQQKKNNTEKKLKKKKASERTMKPISKDSKTAKERKKKEQITRLIEKHKQCCLFFFPLEISPVLSTTTNTKKKKTEKQQQQHHQNREQWRKGIINTLQGDCLFGADNNTRFLHSPRFAWENTLIKCRETRAFNKQRKRERRKKKQVCSTLSWVLS